MFIKIRGLEMTVKFEIGDDLEKSLDEYAHLFGSTKEQFIQEALLEKLEGLEDLRIAKERLENPTCRYSMKEVENEIDLAG